MRPSERKTYDCAPTLNDTQVLDFCKNGYLLLEGVVPDEINQRTTKYLDGDDFYEPTGILEQDWFVENVTLNPAAAGAVRALLGAAFHTPVLMSNHRVQCPIADVGGWHVDGNFDFALELNYLQVFYYPQDTPLELGPTQILPGSHLVHNKSRFMSHLGSIRGAVPTAAPAGSIFLTAYHVWHRRGPSTAAALRNMLKYFYWRTTPPVKDWIDEPGLDPATAFYGGHNTARFTAHMFWWLCGKGDDFRIIGGQGWPWRSDQQVGPSYGYGRTRGYLPDWRRNNPDGYAL